jgi:hypothetical protein
MFGIFSIKLIYSVLLSLPNSMIVTHIKLKSGINLIDGSMNFNPFNQIVKNIREPNAINY